jgi:hypothetical protein
MRDDQRHKCLERIWTGFTRWIRPVAYTRFAIAMLAVGATLLSAGPWIASLIIAVSTALIPLDAATVTSLQQATAPDWVARVIGAILVISGVVFWHSEDRRERQRQSEQYSRDQQARDASFLLRVEPLRSGNYLLYSQRNADGLRVNDTKYVPNGRFDIELIVSIIAGASPISIASISITYYSRGCACVHGPLELYVYEYQSDKDIEILPSPQLQAIAVASEKKLVPELEIKAHGSMRLLCRQHLGTVFMDESPYYCEGGDIELEVAYRTHEDRANRNWKQVYSMTSGGDLEDVNRVRSVPRLSDESVDAALAAGVISNDDHSWIKQYRPSFRYMALCSNIVASNLDIDHERIEELNRRIEEGLREHD